MAAVRRVRLVTINGQRDQSVPRSGERLDAFESAVEVVIHCPQIVMIEPTGDSPDGVGTRQIPSDPAEPIRAWPRLLQGVEAAESPKEHHDRASNHPPRGNARMPPTVRDSIQDVRKAEHLPGVGQDSTQNRSGSDYVSRSASFL